MDEKQRIYVLDTNILVDYPDIITEAGAEKPKNPTVDLTGAHLVIPSAVVRELSSFKRETSDRGRAARKVLKKLRALSSLDHNLDGRWGAYNMENPIKLDENGQTLSILPVHKDFKRSLPFSPDETDMDGQIVLAAISACYIADGKKVDGSNRYDDPSNYYGYEVIILTNDNEMAVRAHERGIKTSRFGYDCPPPYTGRRDLKVPNELFGMLFLSGRVERTEFERLMPDEPRLVANEFVVMEPVEPQKCKYYDPDCNPYFQNVGKYDRLEDAIVPLKFVRSFPVRPLSVGQALYAEALADPNIAAVICTGPAGSGKTYMATIYGYMACRAGQFINVAVVPCETTHKLGALPGGLDEKMDPQVQPLKNALRNYLLREDPGLRRELAYLKKHGNDEAEPEEDENTNGHDSEETSASGDAGTDEKDSGKPKRSRKRRSYKSKNSKNGSKPSIKTIVSDRVNLVWRNWFLVVPVENARGQDFALQLAIYDEFQDQNISQADTLLKRIGDEGKIIITGDIEQIHAPYLDENNNGLVYASGILYDDPMVAQVYFAEEDVVRHPLVKMIAERQKMAKTQKEEV